MKEANLISLNSLKEPEKNIQHAVHILFGFLVSYIDGWVQNCCIPSALRLAMEILQPCTKPSMYGLEDVRKISSLRWRHNERDGVSLHRYFDCLLNRLFRRKSKKISKLNVTSRCEGNSPWPVNSPHKRPVMRKMIPFGDVIMLTQLRMYRGSLLLSISGLAITCGCWRLLDI